MKKKIVSLVLVFALALALGIGGTVAWLTATTQTVTNTFTAGNINIALAETTGTSYKFVPGATISKDPKVSVTTGSEACWLFVKLEKSSNFDSFMTFGIADGWTELTKDSGIYWRSVDASTAAAGISYSVLKDDQVSVLTDVTKGMIDADDFTEPTLKVTAYAIQSANLADQNNDGTIDAADAWALVPKAAAAN